MQPPPVFLGGLFLEKYLLGRGVRIFFFGGGGVGEGRGGCIVGGADHRILKENLKLHSPRIKKYFQNNNII